MRAALSAYRLGMSYRDLGRALDYDDSAARLVWQELRRRGLLHTPGEAGPGLPGAGVLPELHEPSSEADLDRALRAYDEGSTTIDALALALNMSPWHVRPLYTQVKKIRRNFG